MNILKKIWLSGWSDEDIYQEYLRRFKEDMDSGDFDEEVKNRVMTEIGNVENIEDFFKSVLKRDRLRYFNAPNESQQSIKGAFMRTLWILKLIREQKKEKLRDHSVTTFRSPRHA